MGGGIANVLCSGILYVFLFLFFVFSLIFFTIVLVLLPFILCSK